MALKSSLTFVAKRISDAVRKAVSANGLAPKDYLLIGSYEDQSERINLTLGTTQAVDKRRLYADARSELRRAFQDKPVIAQQIALVIRQVDRLEDVYLEDGGLDEFDMTELLERT